jgi:hypothetical protein
MEQRLNQKVDFGPGAPFRPLKTAAADTLD